MSKTRLVNESMEDLVIYILSFMLNLEQIKIISRLYDGSNHIQTVGRPSQSAEISVRATETQKDILNLKEASAELLILFRQGITYKGIIKEQIKWKESVPRSVYEGSFAFLINEVIE
jgi:hypothetical protein